MGWMHWGCPLLHIGNTFDSITGPARNRKPYIINGLSYHAFLAPPQQGERHSIGDHWALYLLAEPALPRVSPLLCR